MQPNNEKNIRDNITLIVTISVVGITVLIGIMSLVIPLLYSEPLNYDFIGSTLLPLWGTWLGTVLAFYFGKSNFEAATKSYDKIINQLTAEEKLSSISVLDAMIPINKMMHLHYEESKGKTLQELLMMKEFLKYERYAILDENDVLKYIIHKSEFTKYITNHLLNGNTHSYEETLERFVEDGIKDPSTQWLTGAGYTSIKSNLLEARKVMNTLTNIQDVFITLNGKSEESILGLITNNIILEKLNH